MTSQVEPDYHAYVFKDGKFVGKFEEMYQAVDDPWHQDVWAHRLKYDLILTLLKRDKHMAILDLGCGKGAFTSRLHTELGSNVIGVDISTAAVRKAQQRYPGVMFQVMDILQGLDFDDGTFDLVVCIELFWYVLKDIHKILSEARRVLRGGHFFVCLDVPENPIGKEVIGSSADLIRLVSTYFRILEIVNYKNAEADINNWFLYSQKL